MFHKSNLGMFGRNLPCDLNGMVPEEGDTADMFTFPSDWDFNPEREDYDDDGFEEWVEGAVEKTKDATDSLEEWQDNEGY